jgi:hypothetical protein
MLIRSMPKVNIGLMVIHCKHCNKRASDSISSKYDGKPEQSKALPLRRAGAKGERQYSSYSFLTSALDWGEWSESRPSRALPSISIG